MTFRASFPLRFAHCDFAGIAYYPRCFELCDAAIEDWTQHALGIDRRHMHEALGLGLPTVAMNASFAAPSRLGDMLDIDVGVRRLGTSSIDLALTVTSDHAPRFAVAYTQVLMRLADTRATPWPADLRAALLQQLEPLDLA
jgi:4-hydroxybenzoyl-CoA thioesterase